jgi:Arc/MetJ family transcription regulator
MRTTLDIDDELMGALLARYPGTSKTEAVERAIREYLSMDAAARAMSLAGRLDIEDVSEKSRRADRHT